MAEVTQKDRALAEMCRTCPVCKHARKKQRGFTFWLVSKIENRFCPACRAYEKVYGRKAHECAPANTSLEKEKSTQEEHEEWGMGKG